jgi:DNA-binding transcriptional ArsR family regulator
MILDLQQFKTEFFKALAHPLRIRILEILSEGNKTVNEIQSIIGSEGSSVSQQLAILRNKNIVFGSKDGTFVLYSLQDPLIKDLLQLVKQIFDNHLAGTIMLLEGIALIFLTKEQPVLASFALLAVLYHLTNHALLKSLLFMGSGAVHMVCHTKNMNLLGGLIRRMPWTALFMLLGSLSIAAMPPMNGFVSKWLLFQSIFTLGFFGNSIAMHLFGALILALLALVGALVAFVFIRFFSMTFLALPQTDMAGQAHEVPLSMRIGIGLLSAGCILLGVIL